MLSIQWPCIQFAILSIARISLLGIHTIYRPKDKVSVVPPDVDIKQDPWELGNTHWWSNNIPSDAVYVSGIGSTQLGLFCFAASQRRHSCRLQAHVQCNQRQTWVANACPGASLNLVNPTLWISLNIAAWPDVVTWTLGMDSMAASLTPVRNYREGGERKKHLWLVGLQTTSSHVSWGGTWLRTCYLATQ